MPKPRTAIGTVLSKEDLKRVKFGTPPVVFEAQTLGYIILDKPEELKQFQEDLKNQFGLDMDVASLPGIFAECGCCVNGRYTSDRCDAA